MAEWDSVSSEEAIDFMHVKIEKIEAEINKLQNFKDYLLEKKARMEAQGKIK